MKKILLFTTLFFFFPIYLQADTKPLPTLELLQNLIRIDTSNPPGNEIKATEYVKNYLSQFGISSEIIESSPGRANLIARLKGNGKKENLVLLGHLDVVPANPQEWTYPPFGAEIHEGYLYGRGSLDMKGLVALEINTFIQLKLQNFPLEGDVILVLVADEEAGGDQGAKFLVENHWDKIKAKYVFNEGSIGNIRDGIHFYSIQVAEKGVAWLKLTASGKSGHGSMPSQENAVLRLIRVMNLLTDKSPPITETPVVRAYLEKLASTKDFPESFMLKHFFSAPIQILFKGAIEKKLQEERSFNAMVRNTLTPTQLNAGYKVNVIPHQATGNIDARILPGWTPESFLKSLREKIMDPHVQLELIQQSLPNASDFETDYFRIFEDVLIKNDPKAVVLPYMSPGATDSRFFREKGAIAYGIIPFLIESSDRESIHGKNERLKISEIERGEKIVWDLVTKMQGKD